MKVLDFLKAPLPDAARVFVVSGSESFLREQAVRKIKDALGEDVEVSLLHGASTRDKEGVSVADLFDELRMQSLFGGGERLIHVRAADQLVAENKDAFKRFIAEGEAVHRLILEGEALAPKTMKSAPKTGWLGAVAKSGGVIVTCPPLFDRPFAGRGPVHESPLSRWVCAQARFHGKRLSMPDAYLLHRAVGSDLRKLDGEIQKLAIFVGERPEIRAEDIERITTTGRMAPIYAVAEAVASRKLGDALTLTERLFERGTRDASGRTVRDPATLAMMLLRSVGRRLEKVLRVRELLDGGVPFDTAAEEVRESPWGRDRLRAQAEAFRHGPDRARVLRELLRLERALKSGGGEPRVLLDAFLVRALDSRAEALS